MVHSCPLAFFLFALRILSIASVSDYEMHHLLLTVSSSRRVLSSEVKAD
jgi:hypothetical protein